MSKQSFKLRIVLFSLIASLGLLSSCSAQTVETTNASQATKTESITPLKKALSEGAFLVDVRTPAEFAAGSVEGAINIPLSEVEDELKQFKGKKNVVVFCRSGGRSAQAKNILDQNGFNNVINGLTWQNVNQNLKEVNSK